MVFIVGVSGSGKKNASIRRIVQEILKACEKHGAQTELVDLAELSLPLFDRRESKDYGENVTKIHDILGRADGFVFGSPEYHASFSGTMKNFFDLLDFKKVLAGKPALFCGIGGSQNRATSLLDHSFVVARALKMWAVPKPIGLLHTDFDGNYRIANPKILERIDDAAKDLVKAAGVLAK